MTAVPSAFGAKVKELRERLDLAHERMAETVGFSFATLNRWENSRTSPSTFDLRQSDLLCNQRRIVPLHEDKA